MPAHRTTASKVPAPLVKHVAQEISARQARLAAQARGDISLIQRRRAAIAESFYDIGEALVRLKAPGVAQALGHPTFAALCGAELKMSLSSADKLVQIVTHVSRADALRYGQEKTLALISLADATPEADAPRALEKGSVKLPSGRTLDVGKASTRDLREAAKEIRAAHTRAHRRGRSSTAEERSIAAAIEKALRAAGLDRARVAAVATKPGAGADLRIEHVPIADVGKLRRALSTKR